MNLNQTITASRRATTAAFIAALLAIGTTTTNNLWAEDSTTTNNAASTPSVTTPASSSGEVRAQTAQTGEESTLTVGQTIKKWVGLSYWLWGQGPSFNGQMVSPGWTGQAVDNVATGGVITLKFRAFNWATNKFLKGLSISSQFRPRINLPDERVTMVVFNPRAAIMPRLGISATFFSTEEWTLAGAINTDLPRPVMLQVATPGTDEPIGNVLRQQNLTIGSFMNLTWTPTWTKFSFDMIIAPRYFIYSGGPLGAVDENEADLNGNVVYRDENGKEVSADKGQPTRVVGNIWGTAQLAVSLQPVITYNFNPTFGLSMGVSTYTYKEYGNGWDQVQNWPLNFMPGITWNISDSMSLYGFASLYPSYGINANNSSVGLQLSGAIL